MSLSERCTYVDAGPYERSQGLWAVSRQSIRKVLHGDVRRSYTMFRLRSCPVMDPYRDVILAWLESDREAPPKQRHTARPGCVVTARFPPLL